jgi:hypothetical protein
VEAKAAVGRVWVAASAGPKVKSVGAVGRVGWVTVEAEENLTVEEQEDEELVLMLV